jgi:biopolymer transport protein ExbD
MPSVDDELDMTPMVDVVFLLLIFFMVTAAFAQQKALEIPPTRDNEAAQSRTLDEFSEDTIIVRVDGDNIFWVSCPAWSEERESPSAHDMLITLREARQPGGAGAPAAPTTLLVLASEDATYEKVVAALDAGSDVGMEQVLLATAEDE